MHQARKIKRGPPCRVHHFMSGSSRHSLPRALSQLRLLLLPALEETARHRTCSLTAPGAGLPGLVGLAGLPVPLPPAAASPVSLSRSWACRDETCWGLTHTVLCCCRPMVTRLPTAVAPPLPCPAAL